LDLEWGPWDLEGCTMGREGNEGRKRRRHREGGERKPYKVPYRHFSFPLAALFTLSLP